LQQNQTWTTRAWNRIQDLEAKVDELEEVCTASERDRKEASELAEQARVRVSESKETAAQIVLAAELRSASILDTAARSIKKAQEDVDRFSREGDVDEEGESVVKTTRADEVPEIAQLADRPTFFAFAPISPSSAERRARQG
jgi:hypothetical protein